MTTILALDFDETLAPTYQAIVAPWDKYMATWLVAHGLYPNEEAARAEYNFENEYGCGPTYFAKKFGQDIPWVEAFYQASAPMLLEAALKKLPPDPTTRELLLKVQAAGYTLAIISQGHRDYIIPLLTHLNLADLFPPHLVIDRAHKRLQPDGFLQLKHLTKPLNPTGYIMADDSAENLITAANTGYTPIHIHPRATPPGFPQLRHHFPTLHVFLENLLRSRS